MAYRIVISVACLVVSAGISVGAVYLASLGKVTDELFLWAIPYEVLFVLQAIFFVAAKPLRRAVSISACVTCVLVLAFTAFVYGIASAGRSSTDAIAFFFAPFYILFGAPLLFLIGIPIAALVTRRRHGDGLPRCSKCGYLLIGLRERRCPECGEPFSESIESE